MRRLGVVFRRSGTSGECVCESLIRAGVSAMAHVRLLSWEGEALSPLVRKGRNRQGRGSRPRQSKALVAGGV